MYSVTNLDDVFSRGSAQGNEIETICSPWVKEVFFQDDDPFDDDIKVIDQQTPAASLCLLWLVVLANSSSICRQPLGHPRRNFIRCRLYIVWRLNASLILIQSRNRTCGGILRIQ